jgi:hypothetical protein
MATLRSKPLIASMSAPDAQDAMASKGVELRYRFGHKK